MLYLYLVPACTPHDITPPVPTPRGGGGGFGYVASPWHSLADVHKGPDIVLQTIRAEQMGLTTFDRIDIVRNARDGFKKIRTNDRRVMGKVPTLPQTTRSRHDRDADALIARTRPKPKPTKAPKKKR